MNNKEKIIGFAIQVAKTSEFEFYNKRTDASCNARICCFSYYRNKGMTHQAIADMFEVKRIRFTQSLMRLEDKYQYNPTFTAAFDAFSRMIKRLEQ